MLEAIKTAMGSGTEAPARDAVRDAVRATKDFEGVATKVSFDDIGDNAYAKVFIYKFADATYPGSLEAEIAQPAK